MKVKSGVLSLTNKRKIVQPNQKSTLMKPAKVRSRVKKIIDKTKIQLGAKQSDSTILNLTSVTKLRLKEQNKIGQAVLSQATKTVKNTNLDKASLSNSKTRNEGKKQLLNTNQSPKKQKKTLQPSITGLIKKDKASPKDITLKTQHNLDASKVTQAVSGLLKLLEDKSGNKPELLDLPQPIFLQVECIKIPICPTKQLRFKLPHPVVNELSDVLLIVADKKGSKIYPEKSEEHYRELLEKHNVNFIQKVLPIRALRQEYSQYEMRRRLVDQYDIILVDANVSKCLSRHLGCFVCYKRKMPISVHLDRSDLLSHLKMAMSKTQMTVKSNGHCSTVQVGTTKMEAADVAANIVEVAGGLGELYPGGWPNVRSLTIKSPTSTALPVYMSLVSSNKVKIPVDRPKRRAGVEGELSTMMDAQVLVRPDGTVVVKKVIADQMRDDEVDDEIIKEADKYVQSAKTVRYDDTDDDDDSDKEADAVTDAVEEELLNEYGLKMNKKGRNKDEGDKDDDEDDESSEEEEEDTVLPAQGKKRKLDNKKQLSKTPANKKQKKGQQQQKQQKAKGNKQNAEGGVKKRGNRAGKKNKVSKDQRKAMIKRKKAGKK